MSDALLPQHTCQLAPLAYARLPPSWQLTAVPPLPWLRLRSPRRRVLPEGCLWPTGPHSAQLLPVRQSPPLPGYPPPLPAVDRSPTVTAIIARVGSRQPPLSAIDRTPGQVLCRQLLAHSHHQSRHLLHSHHDHALLAPLRMFATQDSGCHRGSRFWPHCFCCTLQQTAQRCAEAM